MSTLAIRFGTLYTNMGEPVRNGVLVVADGKIASIGSDVPSGAQTLEAACVVPGLINCHAHFEASGEPAITTVFVMTTPTQRAYICAENARKALNGGVTTVRDLGSTENLSIDLRDAIVAGKVTGPTILAAGRAICMTGGHGWFIGRQSDGPWDVRKAVREQRLAGADCIKFIATGGVLTKGAVPGIEQLSEEELAAGIREAHVHGMRCAAHAIGTSGIKNAIRAGIDSIEHGHLIDEEGIGLMLEHGTRLVPTLCAIDRIVTAGPEAGMPDFVLRKANEIAVNAYTNLKAARAAGVKFAGGSDAGTPFNAHEDYWREVELMVSQLDMSWREALRVATADAADLLGVDRGSVREGAPADLLLLDADLESDARPLRTPRVVVKNGEIAFERT